MQGRLPTYPGESAGTFKLLRQARRRAGLRDPDHKKASQPNGSRIDGTTAGKLRSGSAITKYVSQGKHMVEIINSSAMCPNVKMTKIVSLPETPVVLRVGITSNFQTIFDQTQ